MSEYMGKFMPYSTSTSTSASEPKRHAACDECRKRKLKCSGEIMGCSRCLKQSIPCQYSLQKTMGRPPKKRAPADDGLDSNNINPVWPSPEDIPNSPFPMMTDPANVADSRHLCPLLYWQSTGQLPSSEPVTKLLDTHKNHDHSWLPDQLRTPNLPVPQSSSPWPDFASVSEASAMPFLSLGGFPDMNSLPLTPQSISSDSVAPQCTCLSYLYLCLSHISSLAAFPVNSHTICSLYIAARAVQDVISCQVCPKNFASRIQNIMFTATLLNVVADAWLRVYSSEAPELGMQTATPECVSRVLQSDDPAQTWESWLHHVVRRAIIGGPRDPDFTNSRCANQPDVLTLVQELEDRQRRWHEPGSNIFSNDFHARNFEFGPDLHQHDEPLDEKEMVCLRVAGSTRRIIAKFNFEPHEFPNGFIPNNLKREISP
ncbi:hypothetical protein N7495_001777 [Penicillium taxi]|uniref:uncharacterized protein n=1 Tax=Penicillium taxi TaxID=168475 RepID=UPI002545AE62|nr:uncharacterized protein N7495_001777 [Penicillium taxi]KAJ5909095.1 hypothetical protein N7495_001777 [Penicillium taxi]